MDSIISEHLSIGTADIEVKASKTHGHGVFARQFIPAGALIETCPVLVLSEDVPELRPYRFKWESNTAIALGYGSIYNHSDQPNAVTDLDVVNKSMRFSAKRDIQAGEEIFHHYGKDWFEGSGVTKRDEYGRTVAYNPPRNKVDARHENPLTTLIVLGIVIFTFFIILHG